VRTTCMLMSQWTFCLLCDWLGVLSGVGQVITHTGDVTRQATHCLIPYLFLLMSGEYLYIYIYGKLKSGEVQKNYLVDVT